MRVLKRSNVKVETRRRRTKKFVRALAVLCLVAGVLAGLRYLSFHLEQFKIQTLEVTLEGKGLSSEEVLSRIESYRGAPILAVHLKDVVGRLMEDPRVREARASRQFPGTIKAFVKTYGPRLILNAGRFYYVGADGSIFKEVSSKGDSMDYPVITGLKREAMEEDPTRARETLKDAADLVGRFEAHPVARDLGLSEIHYDRAEGYSLIPEKKNFRILVGFDDFDVKLKRLEAALRRLKSEDRSFASIDLNYEGKVILTM